MSRPPKSIVVPKEKIGSRLRELRRQRGLTQVEVAEALGLTQSNVSGIERGVRGMTIHQVVIFANVLGVSSDEILGLEQRKGNGAIKDRRLLRLSHEIDSLPRREKEALLKTMSNYIRGSRGRLKA